MAPGAEAVLASSVSATLANIDEGSDFSLENGELRIDSLRNPDAYYHVDADDVSSMVVDSQNGTNFVTRWNDASGGSVYATASTKTFENWLPDPENRRPFISEEKLAGRNVVDFGPLQVHSHTNEFGYGVGYGAAMKWSTRMPSAVREFFSVSRDTEDVKTLHNSGNVKVTEFGQAYLCDPDSLRGYRGKLAENKLPPIAYDNGYNSDIKEGEVYVDGVRQWWEYRIDEGFHLLNLRLPGTTEIKPSYFAYSATKTSSRKVLGGTKIAEYLVFPNALTDLVRENIYADLRAKWLGADKAIQVFGNLSVGEGARITLPWRNVSVTNSLSVAGEIEAEKVFAKSLKLVSSSARISGELDIEEGATIAAERLDGGGFGSVTAKSLRVRGAGKVVFPSSTWRRYAYGIIPLVTGEALEGSFKDWTVDASGLKGANVRLHTNSNGLYAELLPQGMGIVVR